MTEQQFFDYSERALAKSGVGIITPEYRALARSTEIALFLRSHYGGPYGAASAGRSSVAVVITLYGFATSILSPVNGEGNQSYSEVKAMQDYSTSLIDLQDDIHRSLSQTRAVVISASMIDINDTINTEIFKNLLWLIESQLEQIEKSHNLLCRAIPSVTVNRAKLE